MLLTSVLGPSQKFLQPTYLFFPDSTPSRLVREAPAIKVLAAPPDPLFTKDPLVSVLWLFPFLELPFPGFSPSPRGFLFFRSMNLERRVVQVCYTAWTFIRLFFP